MAAQPPDLGPDLDDLPPDPVAALGLLRMLAGAIFPEGEGFGDPQRLLWPETTNGGATDVEAELQARLARSESRLQRLVEQIPAVIFLAALGDEGNEVYVSPHIERLLGYTQHEWLTNPLLWYSQMHPDDHQRVINAFTHGVQTGQPFRAEVRFFARDGRVVWISGEAQLVRDQQGRPEYFQGVGFDVTGIREAEQRRQAAERAHADAIQSRAEALSAANEQLSQLNEELVVARDEAQAAAAARATFLATMTHELRTPMNAVIVLAGLLADTNLSPAQQEMLGTLSLAADHQLSLINNILDFSRLRAGRVDLQTQPVVLAVLVEDCLDIVAPRAAEKGLELHYDISPGTPDVLEADGRLLRQVLLNLLGNAVKFTKTGSIHVHVDAAADSDAWLVRCSVTDTGIGIAPDKVEGLFTAFEQADAGIAREYGGSGLGLAISRALAAVHGGTITVASAPGAGSTFTATFRAVAGPQLPANTTTGLAGTRVLVWEPDELARRQLEVGLGALAIDVVTVSTAEEARRQRGEVWDLVIVACEPGQDERLVLASSIRQHSGTRLALAAYDIHAVALRKRIPEASFLHKPLRLSRLGLSMTALLVGEAEAPAGQSPTPTRTTERLRILLAEDDPTNQRVATLLLAALGFDDVTVVASGDAAVDAVMGSEFDVVLMDMMMPRTDGLTATRQIRSMGSVIRQPRIVGLTANAMPGDRESCLEAGMDDYVTKPIERATLLQALRAAAVGTPGSLSPDETPALDSDAAVDLSAPQRLVDSYGSAAFAELVRTFRGTVEEAVRGVAAGLAAGDLESVRRAAHTLKSSAGVMGATALSRLCASIEVQARAPVTGQGLDGGTVERLDQLAREALTWLSGLAGERT